MLLSAPSDLTLLLSLGGRWYKGAGQVFLNREGPAHSCLLLLSKSDTAMVYAL